MYEWAVLGLAILACVLACIRWIVSNQGRRDKQEFLRRFRRGGGPITLGFFHPYCNAGGGGERVLWTAVRACLSKYPQACIVVYTGDVDATDADILQRAHERFGITVPLERVRFVFLRTRWCVEASTFPRFTLIGQSLGSLVMAYEAIRAEDPHVFIGTQLAAAAATLVSPWRLWNSTDMLRMVEERHDTFNNASAIARSALLSFLKLQYYRAFAWAYGVCGRYADVVMVNSTWTLNHVRTIWGIPEKTVIVYPPCDTKGLVALPLQKRQPRIVSLAQFRPEKNHALQIEAFAQLLCQYEVPKGTELVICGSSRNSEDESRLASLKSLAKAFNVQDSVKFVVNASYSELKKYLASALIGLHTMPSEHFGIGIVEFMAAGLIPIAHKSGGPLLDIVVPIQGRESGSHYLRRPIRGGQINLLTMVGFLACTKEEYARLLHHVLSMPTHDQGLLQMTARQSISRFSEAEFERGWIASMSTVC